MLLKNQKGAAIMFVLMIMVVLGILGLAFSQTVISGLRQSSIHGENSQAFYNARSAALIASEMLNDNLEEGTYFLGSDFEETEENGEIAKIIASENEAGMIDKIEAFGYAGPENRSEEKITLNIQRHGNGEDNGVSIPEEIEDIVEKKPSENGYDYNHSSSLKDDDDKEWTNEDGTQINNVTDETDSVVQFKDNSPGGEQSLSIDARKGTTDCASFTSPEIHFENILDIVNADVHLHSPLIVFHEGVNIGNNAKLCFHVPENDKYYEDYDYEGIGYVVFKEDVDGADIPAGTYIFDQSGEGKSCDGSNNGICIENNDDLDDVDLEPFRGGEQIIWE